MPDGVRLAIIAAGVLYVYISNLIWGRPEILLRDAEEQFRAASEKVLAESWAELQRRAKGITP